ncbi:endonuclease-reverse transcriptase [Elysia marginata]|uniref:Endonuclease-reverse transcriptase n=1 Tax=Elysia marginata TaxID=1093978 RepID=A0AAV4F0Y2_9GAST|nr:endonuclease-reverse transcriptase [Elysia marginata]
MTEMDFPQHLISMIASLYHSQKATIRWNNANCEPFNIEKGVRQGCILSPHLFNLYTEKIMRQTDINDMGINIGGRDITNLRYADDTALLSDKITSMKRILHRVNNAGQQAGLLLNAKKKQRLCIYQQAKSLVM